jgi:hypothetical protein
VGSRGGVVIQNNGTAPVFLGGLNAAVSGANTGISLAVGATIFIPSATHCLDIQAELQRQIAQDGATIVVDFEGPKKPHPALAELRAQQGIYIRSSGSTDRRHHRTGHRRKSPDSPERFNWGALSF